MSLTMCLSSRNSLQLLNSTRQKLCRQTYQKFSTAPAVKSGTLISRNFEQVRIPVPWGHLAGKCTMNSSLRLPSRKLLQPHETRKYSTASPLKPGTFISRNFEEITIPVPWGHLAGKWYGPKHVRPLLGLHGWQDNAGTFDTLAPLLPTDMAFLCLDMPGHGLSSWLPEGMAYHSIDYVALLLRIMQEFNWDKLSIMAHSMGSLNSFVFSAFFPDKVDMFIGLDILKPLTRSPEKIVDGYAERLLGSAKTEQRMRNKSEPPCYEWDQLVERLYLGTEKSVEKESCKYLLQRNVKPSSHEPHKYYFSRDNRLKTSLFYAFSNEVHLEMAKRIKCPHLFIKATEAPFYERKEYYDECLEVLKKTNPLFEYHEVSGTHHVHLNEPEKISSIINPFINQWSTRGSGASK